MSDGIPDDRWELAEVIYVARKDDACPWRRPHKAPERKGYTHERQVADFDLALASAKAVLEQFDVRRRS